MCEIDSNGMGMALLNNFTFIVAYCQGKCEINMGNNSSLEYEQAVNFKVEGSDLCQQQIVYLYESTIFKKNREAIISK